MLLVYVCHSITKLRSKVQASAINFQFEKDFDVGKVKIFVAFFIFNLTFCGISKSYAVVLFVKLKGTFLHKI